MIKQDIYSDTWCDIVFEDRNKAYGAYVLRKQDRKNTTMAILISASVFLLAFSLPAIIKLLTPEEEIAVDTSFKLETTLMDAPPLDKTPPPPPVEPPPPLKSTVKFTPPKVVKDEEAEDPPPTQEELKVVDAAIKTEEGDDELGVDASLGSNVLVEEDPNKVFDYVSIEQKPEYPGGDIELMRFLQKNTQYPKMEKENGIAGKVFVSFVIDKDGKVINVEIARGVAGGKGLDKEALRVVSSMPAWKPGKQNGNPVRVKYSLPVNFVLR